MAYTYHDMLHDLKKLHARLYTIGQSLRGRQLYCMKFGDGPKKIFINGAHHGMEWMTSMVLMRFAEELQASPPKNTTVYIVPMVNPDGIEISAGLEAPICDCRDTDQWQANACGVDLNHNYDACWDNSKASEAENGIMGPGPTRFSGNCAESEPESRAVAGFTRRIKPDVAAALHSQGEVIYYDFCGHVPAGGLELGEMMAQASGYALDQPEGIASYGGYKDWFIDKFDRPGYTVEIGLGTNPLPAEDFDKVYDSVLPLLHILIEETASVSEAADGAFEA